MVLAAASMGALLSCQAGGPAPSPTPVPATPSAATPSAIAGVLNRPSTPIPQPTFVQLSVPSANIVWALVAYNYLFRSTDRGGSWEQRPLPPQAVNAEIAFVDEREGWLSLAGSPATQCQAQQTTIWHTADAGATWQSLGASGIADNQCKIGLSFVDASHGFIAASDPNHAPIVYRTADGGRTWSPSAPLRDPPGFASNPGGVSLQPGRVHAFGATLLVTARYASTDVYRSTDGGATWAYLATAPLPASTVAFVSASRWLQLIVPTESRETTDAGASWHPYLTDYSQAAPIAPAIEFGSEQVGYATVRGGIKRTQDRGAHWVTLRTPGTE
jgi:photosystem II stability/assembly factor-like uncharacterized protein